MFDPSHDDFLYQGDSNSLAYLDPKRQPRLTREKPKRGLAHDAYLDGLAQVASCLELLKRIGVTLRMGHVRTKHHAIPAQDVERFTQILILFADHENIAVAEDLARPDFRMAKAGIAFKDTLTHAPVRIHDMHQPRQPFDPCFGKRKAQARKTFGNASADDGEKTHQKRGAVREGDGHEEILKQAGESRALKTDMNVDGHVQLFGFGPKGIKVAAV